MSSISEKEIAILFPEKELTIAGQKITIKPFSFGQTFYVADKLQPVFDIFVSEGETDQDKIKQAIIIAGESIVDVLSMALQLSPETVKQFDNKTAVKAIMEVVKINKDFFVEEVTPALREFSPLLQG